MAVGAGDIRWLGIPHRCKFGVGSYPEEGAAGGGVGHLAVLLHWLFVEDREDVERGRGEGRKGGKELGVSFSSNSSFFKT